MILADHAELIVKYHEGESESFFVPTVDEYENDEDRELGEVFTLEDLYSEITTAFELGSEGVLQIPVSGQNNTTKETVRGFVYLNIRYIKALAVFPTNAG
jgi:hypothetical protein